MASPSSWNMSFWPRPHSGGAYWHRWEEAWGRGVVCPLILIFLLQVFLGGAVLRSRQQGILLLQLQLRLAKVASLGLVGGRVRFVPRFHLDGLGAFYRLSMEFSSMGCRFPNRPRSSASSGLYRWLLDNYKSVIPALIVIRMSIGGTEFYP